MPSLISSFLLASGIYLLTRRFTSPLPRIIMYHGFCGNNEEVERCLSTNVFRRQLLYLKEKYQPYKLSDLIAYRKKEGVYPYRSVVITVDDGYYSFYKWAFPLLREFGIPATVCIPNGLIDQKDWIWSDKLLYLIEKSGYPYERRRELWNALKKGSLVERESRLADLSRKMGITIPMEAPDKYKLMSWKHLQEIAETRLVEIGSHTRTHPVLSSLSLDESWEEVHKSRREIQDRLNLDVSSFFYPYGALEDYRQDQVEMIRNSGYQCAVAGHFGFIWRNSDIYVLPRISAAQETNRFKKYIDGFELIQTLTTNKISSIVNTGKFARLIKHIPGLSKLGFKK